MAKVALKPARNLTEEERQCRQTHWLKVTQYLPEEDERVLVCNRHQGPYIGSLEIGEDKEPYFNIVTHPDWPERGKLGPMTHWKSLPSRPADGE